MKKSSYVAHLKHVSVNLVLVNNSPISFFFFFFLYVLKLVGQFGYIIRTKFYPLDPRYSSNAQAKVAKKDEKGLWLTPDLPQENL